jgi:hypothetical protein
MTNKNFCFECGEPAECDHHVVPKSLGGTKTIPLCLECHGLVHERDFVRHKRLQMIGIAKAKAAGKFTGRKAGTLKKNPSEVVQLREDGLTAQEIADRTGISLRTVFRYLLKEKENGPTA